MQYILYLANSLNDLTLIRAFKSSYRYFEKPEISFNY